jgi:hypothetical protein
MTANKVTINHFALILSGLGDANNFCDELDDLCHRYGLKIDGVTQYSYQSKEEEIDVPTNAGSDSTV